MRAGEVGGAGGERIVSRYERRRMVCELVQRRSEAGSESKAGCESRFDGVREKAAVREKPMLMSEVALIAWRRGSLLTQSTMLQRSHNQIQSPRFSKSAKGEGYRKCISAGYTTPK